MRDFEKVVVLFLTKSGKGLRVELNDLPFTTFNHNAYVWKSNVEAPLEGKRKNATVWMIKGSREPWSCDVYPE